MPFHIGGYQCLRKVELMLRMIPALGGQFSLPLKKTSRYTVEEINDISGLSASYVFSILKEKLRKVCARWIPHLLTSDQKRERVEKASASLTRFKDRDPRGLMG
jgi:hypothetical protein